MNPTQDASFVYSGETHFSVSTLPLSILYYFVINQPITWVLQMIELYQWKDRNVEVKSLHDDDNSPPPPSPLPLLLLLFLLFFLLLPLLPLLLLLKAESSISSNLWKLPEFSFRIFTEAFICLLSARWINLSSITRIQVNKIYLFVTVGHGIVLSMVYNVVFSLFSLQ